MEYNRDLLVQLGGGVRGCDRRDGAAWIDSAARPARCHSDGSVAARDRRREATRRLKARPETEAIPVIAPPRMPCRAMRNGLVLRLRRYRLQFDEEQPLPADAPSPRWFLLGARAREA